MTRWKCICAYNGTDYYGWQSQVGGNTIQDIIEAKLKTVFKRELRIHGAGRTDSGVHAHGQVFHFDADWKHEVDKLKLAINSGLPEDIQVLRVNKAKDDFHARFSAKKKRYIYYCYQGRAGLRDMHFCWSLCRTLNVEELQKAAKIFLGKHDFTSFAASRRDESRENPMKVIYRMDIIRKGNKIKLVTEGSGYLYRMVRSIVGVLVEVGIGNMHPVEVKNILSQRKRSRLVPTAPARGLFLDKVFY